MDDEAKKMQTPTFRFEWNLNTVALIMGIMGGLIAWGYTIQGWNATAEDLIRTQAEVDSLKSQHIIISQLDYRLTANEAEDKARDARMERFADVITLFRQSFADVSTKLEVLANKIDTVGESVKEQRKQGVTR